MAPGGLERLEGPSEPPAPLGPGALMAMPVRMDPAALPPAGHEGPPHEL
jgi:hypothetical protein